MITTFFKNYDYKKKLLIGYKYSYGDFCSNNTIIYY